MKFSGTPIPILTSRSAIEAPCAANSAICPKHFFRNCVSRNTSINIIVAEQATQTANCVSLTMTIKRRAHPPPRSPADVIIFCAVTFIAIYTPLAIGGAPNYIRLPTYLACCIGLLAWAFKTATQKSLGWFSAPINLPIIALMIYVFARAYFTPVNYTARQEILMWIAVFSVYFLVVNNLHRRHHLQILLFVIAFTIFASACYGIIQYFKGTNFIYWQVKEQYAGRAAGTYYCPNHLAAHLEIVLAFTLSFICFSSFSNGKKIILIYLSAIFLIGIFTSLSRSGWLGTGMIFAFLAVIILFRITKTNRNILLFLAAIFFCCIAVAGIGIALYYLYEPFQKRIVQIGQGDLQTRIVVWKTGWKVFLERPVFGQGAGMYEWIHSRLRSDALQMRPVYAHNEYIHMLANYGAVGLAFMCWLILEILRLAKNGVLDGVYRKFKIPQAIGLLLALLAMLAHGIFDFQSYLFGISVTFAILLGLMVGRMQDSPYLRMRKLTVLWPKTLLTFSCIALAFLVLYFTQASLGDGLYRIGEQYLDADELKRSKKFYQLSLLIDSRNYLSLERMGDLHRSFSSTATTWPKKLVHRLKAVEFYERGLQLNPYFYAYYTKLGMAYDVTGHHLNALDYYLKAIEHDPDLGWHYTYLGNNLYQLGYLDQALAAFRKAYKLYPEDSRSFKMMRKIKQLKAKRKNLPPETPLADFLQEQLDKYLDM